MGGSKSSGGWGQTRSFSPKGGGINRPPTVKIRGGYATGGGLIQARGSINVDPKCVNVSEMFVCLYLLPLVFLQLRIEEHGGHHIEGHGV